MSYKAEDFIKFIESNRRDKVSPEGLDLIAKRFRELESEIKKLSLFNVVGRSKQLVCDNFEVDNLTSSATKCKNCWGEKWQHTN